jgi:hypothetical protein
MLITCALEESRTCAKLVQCKCYELVKHGKTRNGDEYKVLQLQYKEITTHCFLECFKPKLSIFVLHNHVAWF